MFDRNRHPLHRGSRHVLHRAGDVRRETLPKNQTIPSTTNPINFVSNICLAIFPPRLSAQYLAGTTDSAISVLPAGSSDAVVAICRKIGSDFVKCGVCPQIVPPEVISIAHPFGDDAWRSVSSS